MFCSCQRKIVRSFSEEIYYQKEEMPSHIQKAMGTALREYKRKKRGYETK